MGRPINGRHIRLADLLIPKRGKTEDYDPLIVIGLWRNDGKARVKDSSLTSQDEGWQRNHCANPDGSQVKTLDELNRNYIIACEDDRECWNDHIENKKDW
jgi:hypothetical protein